ncbi:MAG TPA: GAF domain-containing protein, partial [Anaerolineae bacterium]|nr:GAF domain-containing protein [Anaerolineae bacterium]
IYFKDAASRFTRINRAQAHTLGIADPQQAVGKTDADFFPPELAALMLAEERQIIETGQPVLSREEYNPTRDGQPRWFSVSKNPLFDQTGHIVGLVGMSRDITAVKLREREFEAMSIQNAQLLAAEREQRTLAEALRDTAAALNSTLNVDEVLDRVLGNIERVVPHDIANIMLINDEDGQAVARVARCHGYDRISPELDGAIRQLRFPVMAVANLRQMLETGQPFIIGDTRTYPDWLDSPATHWQRSYVGAPIHLRDSVIGFIQLDSREVNFFTPTAAERLQTFANQTAVAIENARLFQAEREQYALAEALRDAASLLSSTLDFDEVIDRILSNVGRIVPNDVATLLLIEHGIARVMQAVGYVDPEREARVRRLRFPIAQMPNLRRVVETQRPHLVANTTTDPAWTAVEGVDWIKSNIVAPMIIKGQVIGMLALDSTMPYFYTPLQAERLQVFAAQAAVALENAQLFDEAQQRLKELAMLFDSSRAIAATLDRATVLRTITRRLAEAVDATSVYGLSVDLERGLAIVQTEYFSPDANDLERVSDLGTTYSLGDIPQVLVALRNGRPSITYIDQADVQPFAVAQLRYYGSQSSLRVPMNVAGEVRAYAVIWDSRTPRRWTDAEIQLCQTLANQAAVALENVRLLEETQQGLKEQSALLAASTAVSSSLDLPTVLQRLAEQMGRAIDATSVYVCEWNQAANASTVVVDYYGPGASELERQSDLGVIYDLVTDYGPNLIWQQPGGSLVVQVDDPDLLPDRAAHLRQYGCWSVLTVGLIARSNVFGFIELWETRQRRYFTPAEIALCQAIAQQAAIAFENARLFEAERKQLRLAQTLQAVGALLTAQMSLNEVFEYIFDLLARVVAYDSVSVQLLEDDRLALTAGRGFPDASVMREIISQVSRPTLEERWGQPHHRVITLPDTHADPRWIGYPGSEYIRSWIGAALRVKGRLLGILNVDSRTPHAYTAELGDTVAAFANQAAVAIENAQLNEAVRRHADELEERVIERTAELEHERKRTAAILDTAGEGIVFTDSHGTIEYINQAMERLSGYLSAEALGQNPRLWKSGETSPALYHEMWDTIKCGRIWQGELVNRRKDGGLYDAALTIAPLHDADGHIAGFVGVQRDITQRKELERLKDEFVSNVSHELRTPIANVKL